MFGNSSVVRGTTAALTVCALALVVPGALPVHAQTPELYISVDGVFGYVGQLVSIPVRVQTVADSLDGFKIEMSLSRDDLIYIEVDTQIVPIGGGEYDTLWVCQVDTAGTLTSGWEHVEARATDGKGLDLRLSGVSDLGSGTVPGIPDYTNGVLLRFFARVLTGVPDTMTDRTVTLDVYEGACWYSNQVGQLIQPVDHLDGSLTVQHGIKGDVSCDGLINPVDVVRMVNYVYKGWQSLCQVPLGDLNCSGTVNPSDVVIIVNKVYKGWPFPPC